MLEQNFEARVVESMQTGIRDGLEPPVDLVRRSGSRIKCFDIIVDGPLDGRIITHVEVQIFDGFGAAPIASDHMAFFDQQHGHRDGGARWALVSGNDQQTMAIAFENTVEKVPIQVTGCPWTILGIGFEVKIEHGFGHFGGDFIAGVRFDLNAVSLHAFAFTTNIASLGRLEFIQVIFKRAIAEVFP